MTSVLKIQYKKIDNYAKLLDTKKVKPIINILQLFYDTFNYENDSTSVVSWLDNQIIYFLDPYGFDEKYQKNRRKLLDKLDDKFSNCNYTNVSLDKIILEMFSWNVDELKAFYKINKKNSESKELSVFNLKLRKREINKGSTLKKGGGLSNDYVLYYIKSLGNTQNFIKTALFFNNLSNLRKNYPSYDFLENELNVTNIYVDKNIPFANIEKLFLYLLNISIVNLDKINNKFNNFYIKFGLNKKLHKIYSRKTKPLPINDKKWICVNNSNKYSSSYLFYKIIKDRLQKVRIELTKKTNYIISISFSVYESEQLNYSIQNYYFYFSNIEMENNKKFFIYDKSNEKKIKNMLLLSSKDFLSEFGNDFPRTLIY
jgi:hypothetical protein